MRPRPLLARPAIAVLVLTALVLVAWGAGCSDEPITRTFIGAVDLDATPDHFVGPPPADGGDGG